MMDSHWMLFVSMEDDAKSLDLYILRNAQNFYKINIIFPLIYIHIDDVLLLLQINH